MRGLSGLTILPLPPCKVLRMNTEQPLCTCSLGPGQALDFAPNHSADCPYGDWLTSRPKRDQVWHDPTNGRIDRDIQEAVDQMEPTDTAQRVAIENTLQIKRCIFTAACPSGVHYKGCPKLLVDAYAFGNRLRSAEAVDLAAMIDQADAEADPSENITTHDVLPRTSHTSGYLYIPSELPEVDATTAEFMENVRKAMSRPLSESEIEALRPLVALTEALIAEDAAGVQRPSISREEFLAMLDELPPNRCPSSRRRPSSTRTSSGRGRGRSATGSGSLPRWRSLSPCG